MTETTRAVTVRLEEQDYERLEHEATRLGMRPGTLARVILRASLGVPERQHANPSISLQPLLERLAILREGLPPVDAAAAAVAAAAAARAELERRGTPDQE